MLTWPTGSVALAVSVIVELVLGTVKVKVYGGAVRVPRVTVPSRMRVTTGGRESSVAVTVTVTELPPASDDPLTGEVIATVGGVTSRATLMFTTADWPTLPPKSGALAWIENEGAPTGTL